MTASSAVPLIFNPVVIENYPECKKTKPDWLVAVEKLAAGDPELVQVVDGLRSYFIEDKRQYAHFVDGGITDNLGLRALYGVVRSPGSGKVFLKKVEKWAAHLSRFCPSDNTIH